MLKIEVFTKCHLTTVVFRLIYYFSYVITEHDYTGDDAFEMPGATAATHFSSAIAEQEAASTSDMLITAPSSRISKARVYHDKLMVTAQKLAEVAHVTVSLEKVGNQLMKIFYLLMFLKSVVMN